ncbi:MAG: ATP-dependent Clp protease ATP-binding subunit [Clostridia bacterium]|nr:ATP-dependent Clp protease ATP-binding subunit [Clostridia bacterium]
MLLSDILESLPYTNKAKAALKLASNEALLLNGGVVGTEHILLGLCADKDGVAGAILSRHHVDTDSVRGMILKLSGVEQPKEDALEADIQFSVSAARVLARSEEIARGLFPLKGMGLKIGTEHILISLFKESDSVAVRIMAELGVNAIEFFTDLQESIRAREFVQHGDLNRPEREPAKTEVPAQGKQEPGENHPSTGYLQQFGRDMTLMAISGRYDPVIGRREETGRLLQILSRKSKNNPCLVGEPGVGKTAIVEGLAQRLAAGNVPDNMKDMRLIALDMSSIVAGTKYRGEFEERMQKLIEEAILDRRVILFIDEIHTIIGSGGSEGSLDAANILKPALSRGELRVIGATTQQEYRKYFEKDAALARRFQSVQVQEPNDEQTLEILRGLRKTYERFHGVEISDEVLESCVQLSKRYIHERCLPDKAIDLMDEAASAKRMLLSSMKQSGRAEQLRQELNQCYQEKLQAIRTGDKEAANRFHEKESMLRDQWVKASAIHDMCALLPVPLSVSDIEQVVSAWTGVPVVKLGEAESSRLLRLEEQLHERVVGQHDAISAVSKAVRRGRTGMQDPKRPIGSFIFLGPTGVGKTEVAKALAQALFNDEKYLIRVDMSEYMEAHSVSRMVGSPPGYVGHDDGGQLTDRVRSNPYSVVLFDEIEKAHPDVFNILLQVLEDGQLTDTKGRRVDFRNTVIIMTSNVGARNITEPKRLGFAIESETDRYEKMQSAVMEELRKTFKPEFLNRVDETVVFKPLGKAEIREIAALQLSRLVDRCLQTGVTLSYDAQLLDYIAEKGYSSLYGARPLKRLIQQEVEDLLSEAILKNGGANHPFNAHLFVEEGKVALRG